MPVPYSLLGGLLRPLMLDFRLLDAFMKAFIISILLCVSLRAADTTNAPSSDKRLVEVTFAADDKPPTQRFHIVMTLWLSEENRGHDRFVYDWAVQGGSSPDSDTLKKAAESLKLLQALDEPKDLPESPNQIVTVRCTDGDKWLVKRFPIDKVPPKVHQILTIMGFQDGTFNRLKFTK
jgi:hypothetical protein